MRKTVLWFSFILLYLSGCAQTDSRINITSIVPSENTGQNYSSWLSDDLNNLVPNCWNSSNFKYIDVRLQLESKSKINKISLYDFEGIFLENPATIYALNGNQKTLIGTFTGEQYKVFTNIIPDNPVIAEALIIHKYCNNIPQKVYIYGSSYDDGFPPVPEDSLPLSVITFDSLPVKTMGDDPLNLIATSNNTETSVTFISSDTAVVSIAFLNNVWTANIKSSGIATITASQSGNDNFKAAADVTRTLIVQLSGSGVVNGKIPVDAKRWFQLTNASNGLNALFDGKTNAEVQTGWGKILDNYDSYYPVLNGEQINITGVRIYDGAGSNTAQPMTLSVITSAGERIKIATFTGIEYNAWIGPDPNNPAQFKLKKSFNNIKYFVINSWNFFPTEIELYGDYTPGKPVTQALKKSFPLKQMFGVNGFEWNFEDPKKPYQIDNQLFKAAKTFTGFRHYMDWEKLEISQGSYTYNPTNSGGWNYDVLYDSCKAAGIEVLACLKTLPGWMLNTYPGNQRDNENVPVKFGRDFSNPKSYIEQAKAAFQYAARYGSNKNVNRALLSVNSKPRWAGDNVNTIKVGLGTVKYIECDNERDKWWKGRKAYQTPYEYAANLSAFYDGNKNTMGAGVGIKNADSNMQVVMAGTALATTDYLKGMVDWCRRYRGYKTDGSVNLCWDVINYHYYSNDSYASQSGNATRGSAPEVSGAATVAAEFLQAAHQYCNDMPVWVTELGYDANQGSPFKAIRINNKKAQQTQADWILRSSLLYARSGVERVFFYELYDDNLSSALQFSSSGLINANKTRKPAADYIYQANKLLGEYTYKETIYSDPIVDRYELNGNTAYIVVVPDEKGRTAQYTLDLGNSAYAKIYTPKTGSDTMEVRTVATPNGKLEITATETPAFIIPAGKVTNNQLPAIKLEIDNSIKHNEQFENTVKVFPNPSSNFINVIINNKDNSKVEIKVSETGTGRLFKNLSFRKDSDYISKSINIQTLPIGYYFVTIKQGINTIIKKFLKAH